MSSPTFSIAVHQAASARLLRRGRLLDVSENGRRWRISLIQPRNTAPARPQAVPAARTTTERIKACS